MKDKVVENIFKDYKILIDTCSLMAGQKALFYFDIFPLIRKVDNKVGILESVEKELNKNLTYSDRIDKAKEGLEILDYLRKNHLVEFIKVDESGHADHHFVKHIFDLSKKEKICLITEDKNLAKDVLINIKTITSSAIKHDITAIKIGSGDALVWTIEELERKLDLVTNPSYTIINQNKNHKLLVTIVLDNSASMKGNKIEKIKSAIENFHNNLIKNNMQDYFEYSINIFDSFSPKTIKRFDEEELNPNKIFAGGIPLLEKLILESLVKLEERISEINNMGRQTYKSWVLLLSDGQNFGNIENAMKKIDDLIKKDIITLFPFALSDITFDESLKELVKYKRPLVINDFKYDKLFEWVFSLAVQRISTPINEKFSLKPDSFNGWAQK